MQRGRELGFPTANLQPENEILPGAGVYAGRVRVFDDKGRPGAGIPSVVNVGYRPTFDDGRALVAEAHLIDFTGDLYGRTIEFAFESRLRSEMKFDSPAELEVQIERDVSEARRQLAGK
jgi:riboflavin kinase/FMN adenylyltransferase